MKHLGYNNYSLIKEWIKNTHIVYLYGIEDKKRIIMNTYEQFFFTPNGHTNL